MSLKLRALAMRKMRRSGNGVRTVAKAFGVSVRTVQREMKRRVALLKIASSLPAAPLARSFG